MLVAHAGEPGLVIDADGFLRGALLEGDDFVPNAYCHRPILVRDGEAHLVALLPRLHVEPTGPEDDVVDRDLILLWTPEEKRVLTGADILGRLLRGIATRDESPPSSTPRSPRRQDRVEHRRCSRTRSRRGRLHVGCPGGVEGALRRMA